jgi:putative endonuclease
MTNDIHVYMLRCADGSYYVGSYRGAWIETRVAEHNAGKYPTAYTFTRRPVELVWSDYFLSAWDAIAFERRLKGWSRMKKEAFLRGDWEALKACSRRGVRPAAARSSAMASAKSPNSR